MNRDKINFIKSVITILGIALIVDIVGCGAKQQKFDAYLVKVGQSVLTVQEFTSALEVAKAAYNHNVIKDPSTYKALQLSLLNQLTEELLIMERGRDLNISVSDQELQKAIAKVKEDYPEDSFEQVLLENAVSYTNWVRGLKRRLTIEKVIHQELEEGVSIKAEDIKKYYEDHYSEKLNTADSQNENSESAEKEDVAKKNLSDEEIVKLLKKDMAQNKYLDWINGLKKKYKVEVNLTAWKKLTGMPDISSANIK